MRWRLARTVSTVLPLVLGLAGAAVLVYYWDPTRAVIKSLTTKDVYRYHQIDPRLRETDPRTLIRPPDRDTLAAKRTAL
ncbi:MAG: hypothetical protein HQL35_15335, partial [Alphaproteobacteria bacterium]|nr:hypothetical protein [Alphaproteobacteria bacterium]